MAGNVNAQKPLRVHVIECSRRGPHAIATRLATGKDNGRVSMFDPAPRGPSHV